MSAYKGNDRPGATIGIIHNGVLVFKKGYGMANIAQGIPNNPDIVYKVASVSKQFTAASIVSLMQQHQIQLTDTIGKYIKGLPDYGKPITIANLLYHTSGLRDYMALMWLSGKSFEDKFTNKDALNLMARQTALNFTTGHRCVYSNSNYIWLTELVQKVTGTSLKRYAYENIFKPLGMSGTGFDGYKVSGKKVLAQSYKNTSAGYQPYKNNNKTYGDGGLWTNLEDLLHWDNLFYDTMSVAASLLKTGQLENGNRLSYGMGIMWGNYRQEPVQMHPGAFLGYRAEILRFPGRNITIICLANAEDINPETLTRQIADLYVFKLPLIDTITPEPTVGLAEAYDPLMEGRYEVAPNVFIDIRYENQQWTGQATGQPRQKLVKEVEQVYKIGTTTDKVLFTINKKTGARELQIVQPHGTTVAVKLELITGRDLNEFVGEYESPEQKVTYKFFIEKGQLWFKVGANPKEKANVIRKYNKLNFSYQNLEAATMEFSRNSQGLIDGFTLSSGRVYGIKFFKK